MVTTNEPGNITVRMYNVGFGDCILLTFHYPHLKTRPERHMLVDCGSTQQADGVTLAAVVADIKARIDQLDVLVVTHRHADHLSAFGAQDTGAVLESLAPKVMLRPWVDDPDIPPNADEPALAFANSLHLAQGFAYQLQTAITQTRGARGGRSPELLAAAATQSSNALAASRLRRMAQNIDARYLHATPEPLNLRALPGVTINVLGPPTYRQLPAAKKQASDYKDQYWLQQMAFLEDALGVAGLTSRNAKTVARAALDAKAADAIIGPQRWLIAKMQDRHEQALARIVEGIDNALNNTSLILQLQVGTRKMLLPGDAQGENWSWALNYAPAPQRRAWRNLLSNIDLYKVGHHGSRNATPKDLYQLWVGQQRKLVSLVSTDPDKFPGKPGRATEVPRTTLLTALRKVGPVQRTDQLGAGKVSFAVQANARGRDAFARVAER